MKKVIDRRKRSNTLSEVKLVKNISNNLQSFLEISPMQKEVLPGVYRDNLNWEVQHPGFTDEHVALQVHLVK